MNHFLRFHNFISSDNTVNDFQIFFTIVALTRNKSNTSSEVIINRLSKLVRTFCDNHKAFAGISSFTNQINNTRNNKIKQKRVGNQSQILED